MNIVVEKQPKCVAILRVEIPAEAVKAQRDQIVKTYSNKVRIQGFRPGKAPRAVVEKRFEKEIREELYHKLINEAYDEAIKQEALNILDFGVAEDLKTNPDGTVSFVCKLTLAPEVTLPEYKGLTVTVPPLALPEEEIEAQITSLQERFAEFNDITDRPAAMGDFAVIDYSSTVEGKPTEEFLGKPAGYLAAREDCRSRNGDLRAHRGAAGEGRGVRTEIRRGALPRRHPYSQGLHDGKIHSLHAEGEIGGGGRGRPGACDVTRPGRAGRVEGVNLVFVGG
jgi:hypothetical protein